MTTFNELNPQILKICDYMTENNLGKPTEIEYIQEFSFLDLSINGFSVTINDSSFWAFVGDLPTNIYAHNVVGESTCFNTIDNAFSMHLGHMLRLKESSNAETK